MLSEESLEAAELITFFVAPHNRFKSSSGSYSVIIFIQNLAALLYFHWGLILLNLGRLGGVRAESVENMES